MANNRIYYASQAAQVRPADANGTNYANWYHPLGVQSVAMTTNFNREQAFQLGTVEIYDNIETVPEVQVTISRVIDSTSPLYSMCMGGSSGASGADNASLVSLSNNRVHFRLGIYEDNKQFTDGAAKQYVLCTGMYLSSFTYTLPVEGNATEEITLVGNNKFWNKTYADINTGDFTVDTIFDPATTFDGGAINPTSASGILRRQYFNIQSSVLPTGSGGIGGQNANQLPHLQNITFSANLGRESINQLGKFGPYCRYATFPIEVTSEFQVIAQDGDCVDSRDFKGETFCGTSKTNLKYLPIKLTICDAVTGDNGGNALMFDLGTKNTLTSVNYAGGDTGGGNATVTYSFRNFNDFKIIASGSYKKGVYVADNGGTANAASFVADTTKPTISHLDLNSGENDNASK